MAQDTDPSPDTMAPASTPTTAPRTPLPDFADIIYLLILLLLINLKPMVLGDGSTGWHLYTGQYILSHHQIPHIDLFSYTFPDKAWVPYEWFFDTVAATLFNIGGIKMVAVAADCSLALLFSLVYYGCRKRGCHFLLAMFFTVLGILTSTIHWLARPHLFTFFGVLIFSSALESFRRGEIKFKRLLITLGLTMLVWANAHPAFLFGFALIAIYLVCETFIALIGAADSSKSAWRRSQALALTLVACIAVSFINPNGWQLHAYILQYLHHSDVIAATQEFMPPDFHKMHAVCMALLFFAFVVGLFISRRKIALSPLMMVLAFAWLGINSMRNEPLFSIIAVPVIASLYADCDLSVLFDGVSAKTASWFNQLAGFWRRVGETVNEVESSCDMHLIPVAATIFLFAVCLSGGNFFGMPVVVDDFDPATKPSTTLEAMKKLPEKGGFNLDNWGGYITYKTGRRVFIDDRLDFYGRDFFLDYAHIIGLSRDWKDLIDKYKINWILLPKEATLIDVLRKTPDWEVAGEDKAAILIVRKHPL
ncbi:MAG TPA: hypothetical protein V6D22_24090 [Candidatus Obscuribacterales bacterium]